MKIFLNTFGSRGDVQPFVILGKAFKEQGHTVMVCTSSRYEAEIVENGLEYGYITDEAFSLLEADSTILEDSIGFIGMIRVSLRLIKIAKPINKKMIQNAWEAAKIFNPDLVIYHPKALGAVSIAEKFSVPAIMLSLMPMLAPTAKFPVIGMPTLKIGGWYNKFTYKLVLKGYNSYLKGLNEVRTSEMGLDKLAKNTGITARHDKSLVPIIHAISPHVLEPPRDWPSIYTMSGYITEKEKEEYTPPKRIKDFLKAGSPPVYVGFGSMSGTNPKRLTEVIVNALCEANVRGIIATGWGGLKTMDLPDSIMAIEKISHTWLFPQVAAVIHHGGAGTTAAGLKAGCPTIICPFMGDQPFWGDQVFKLGAGLKVSSQKRLKAEELADAIRKVTTDNNIRETANTLGKKMQSEDGVRNVISIIGKLSATHK